MNRAFLLFSLSSCLLILSPRAVAITTTQAPIYLEVGEQRLIHFESLHRYSVSGAVVRYVRIPNQNQILLKALKAGSASLTVFTSPSESETRAIKIEQKKNFKRPDGFLQAISTLNEVEAIDQGDHFVIRGKVLTKTEASNLRAVLDHYPALVVDETELDGVLLERSRRELSVALKPYPSLRLQAMERTLSVSGSVSSVPLKQSITKSIRTIQPLTQVEIQTISDQNPTIYFKVFLLEVKKEVMTNLGVEWPGAMPAAFQFSPAKFLINPSLDLSVHALSEKGLVHILSSPELVVRAPGQAELFAGGELPIRQRSRFNEQILWKNVGLSLKLDVKEYGGDKVRLNVETEMSHLDGVLTDEHIPMVQSNRMKTQVDATLGKPILLSGLLQEGLRERVKGLPALAHLPVLGRLFGSKDFKQDRSELVAILLPQREPPQNPMLRISSDIPKGYLPLPRNVLETQRLSDLKNDRNYPWNALE